MGELTDLTAEWQVTIPKDVREALGLVPNEPVEIAMLGEHAAVIRKPTIDLAARKAEIAAKMRETLDRFAHLREGLTTEEIMREIRGDDPFPP